MATYCNYPTKSLLPPHHTIHSNLQMLQPDLGVILGLRLTTGDISTSPRLSSGIHQEPSISWDLHTSSQYWVRHLPLPLQLDDDGLLLLTEASDGSKLCVSSQEDVRPGVTQPPRTSWTSSTSLGLAQPRSSLGPWWEQLEVLSLLLSLGVLVVLGYLDLLSWTDIQDHQLTGASWSGPDDKQEIRNIWSVSQS